MPKKIDQEKLVAYLMSEMNFLSDTILDPNANLIHQEAANACFNFLGGLIGKIHDGLFAAEE